MKEIYGILLLIAIGAWLFAALFHPAIRPTRYLHPLFTTIRSNLSKDMLKKMDEMDSIIRQCVNKSRAC